MKLLFTLLALFSFSHISFSQTIFPFGSGWKYLDNGSDQATSWRAAAFNDGSWLSGNAQLGYGDGDEATVVGYGPDLNNKYVTTYFRKTFSITNPASFSGYTANLRRDDGVVIYLNGLEVYRNNITTGTVLYSTLADLASDDGNTIQTFNLPANAFINGNNTFAVEIHQNTRTSTDISFDLELIGTPAPTSTTLVAYGSSWKYLDNGSNQGTPWTSNTFNDASWPAGNAQLGYGDGDETTVISYGGNTKKKYITTYFRKSLTIADATLYSGYTLNLKRDDGAVVYINGIEVFRSNMPTGAINHLTKASTAASDNGNTPQIKTLSSTQLRQGINVIAVEMHQNAPTSTDLSFDLELKANSGSTGSGAVLTRGPYLNKALQSSIVIRWRTNVATNSKVSFGSTAGNLTASAIDNTLTTEHVVTLTGLSSNTLYYYAVGSSSQTLQGDAANYFRTMPPAGSTQKVRVLAMGDMGNNSTNQINVRNAWLAFNANRYTDAWLLLGDNAYPNGTDAEYQSNFYNIYQGSLTKNHVLWPAPGNHDYANNSARQADHAIPYYDMFSLPATGEAGGVASNTEAFYSYNYGNVHFVALDSYGWESGNTRLYDTSGRQAVWLKQDLAANTQPWTVVYFHHPPYTKGSHNSDTENELISMRQRIVPILERYKVDLVLNGHSHSYERSILLNGHYGLENTYNSGSHALSTSGAAYNGSPGSCTYIKNASDVRNGIVYALAGSAGQLGGSTTGYPHNAMHYSNVTNGGALFFEIEDNRLDAKWICADGVVRDNFTIMKDVNKTSNISVVAGSSVSLTASWIGNYAWSGGETTRSINVTPNADMVITVSDGYGCITDVFNITVSSQRLRIDAETIDNITLYPTAVQKGQTLHVQTRGDKAIEGVIIDVNGKVLRTLKFSGKIKINTNSFLPGTYFLKWRSKDRTETKKFIITK